MKRVLHIAKFYPPVPGGMERVVQMLCRASEGMVDSRVLAFHTGRRTVHEVADGVQVTRAGRLFDAGSVPVSAALPWQLRRQAADFMIVHEPNPWALLSLALARPAAPLAVWYHSDVVRPALQYRLFYAPVADPVYARAARFVVSSPPLARHAAALAPYRDRIRVIPFAIDAADWQRSSADAGEPFALFAGRHVPYKGVDVLLRALAGTSLPAVIVGDGPKRAEWTALARELGLEGRVRFTGDVADAELRRLLGAAAAVVLPSVTRAEAFGMIQLEAMASGTPVISTDLPSGVPWVNQHGTTGLVVPPGDVEALRAALLRVMADQSLRRTLGGNGRRRVESEFSVARLRERLRAFYAELGLLEAGEAAC